MPPPLIGNHICSSFVIYKERKSVSTGQILHTGNERVRARQREIFHLVNASSSTFGSHCLHFRPRHSSLPLFFVLVLIHLSLLLKTKLCTESHPSFFRKCYTVSCPHKEQRVAPCKKKEHCPLKQTGIFKIKQGRTMH